MESVRGTRIVLTSEFLLGRFIGNSSPPMVAGFFAIDSIYPETFDGGYTKRLDFATPAIGTGLGRRKPLLNRNYTH